MLQIQLLVFGKTGEDYHKNENIFFTGYQGDPTGQKPDDKDWYGIANLVADRTPAVGRSFTTSLTQDMVKNGL